MKHTKISLILCSALAGSSLIAQEQQPGSLAWESARQDVRLAQGPPPVAPGMPQPPRAPAPPHNPVEPVPAQVGGGGVGGGPKIIHRSITTAGGGGFAPAVIPFQEHHRRTLVVGSEKLDETARKNIREDMQIMSRILDKSAEGVLENAPNRRLGITVMTLPGTRGENIYLEDYGALFVLNVPMPLTGSKPEDGSRSEADSDWEQAKRELYEKRGPGSIEPAQYDPKKVEALKQALLESLKNASNIRQLKPDQTVTVLVTGGEQGIVRKDFKEEDREDGKTDRREKIIQQRIGGAEPTTIAIRVKKSDIDAFAKGKLDLETFSKRASITNN